MNLTTDAMLVSLRIHSWSGWHHDRQASRHVAVAHDARTDAGRYTNRLLWKPAFAALSATLDQARSVHYANTIPWGDQGQPLFTVANYPHYTAEFDAHVDRRDAQQPYRIRFRVDYGTTESIPPRRHRSYRIRMSRQ